MNQQHYRGKIMKRFLTKEEQKVFDEKYAEAKTVSLGQSVVELVEVSENQKKELTTLLSRVKKVIKK